MEAEAREAIRWCFERVGWCGGGVWYAVVGVCTKLAMLCSEGLEELEWYA